VNRPRWMNPRLLIHAARNALAGVGSLALAQALHLSEPFWACITTFVVLQSQLRPTLDSSWQRLAGTALGAVAGAWLAIHFGASLLALGEGVFAVGLICAALKLDNSFRLGNITLAIVLLVAHAESPWGVAIHRFLEVSLGIAVALAFTAVWPEAEPAPAAD
jgi:uncharacterized membrane protein YccC